MRRSTYRADNGRAWQFQAVHEAAAQRLARACDLPLPIAHILYQRGYTSVDEVKRFMEPTHYPQPDPFIMAGMHAGVERILGALNSQERIVIYGDYDVDGQASTALVVSALQRVGARVDYYVPHRLEEGYGLNRASIAQLAEDYDLLITVDCGSTSVDEVALADQLGLDCIITDHHEVGPVLPDASAVINPKRADCPYPEKGLAGCGVAFKLVRALYAALGRDPKEVDEWIDLVALATIADIVPLRGENRAFVAQGLPLFQARPGLQALCEVAGVENALPRVGQVAFSIAPRLNAAGRLDDASLGVRLLLCTDLAEARGLAAVLDAHNSERRGVEQVIFDQAQAWVEAHARLDDERALVVAGEGWHRGVIGIVASRLVEAYGRPVLVISSDGEESVGSGRSIAPFNLYDGLSSVSSHFTRFGGHSMAAGFTLPTASVEQFRHDFLKVASDTLAPADLLPSVRIDAILELSEVDLEFALRLEQLGPFGLGNPEPVVALRQGRVLESRRIGRDQSHWRATIGSLADGQKTLTGIGFGLADAFAESVSVDDTIDIAGNVTVNHWQGRKEVQVQVRDVRTSVSTTLQAAEKTLLIPSTMASELSGSFHPPAACTVNLGGRKLSSRLFDLRHHEGDVRTLAVSMAQRTADTVLVWTAAEGMKQGIVSRIRLAPEGEEANVALICAGAIPETARPTQRIALVFWSLPSSLEEMRATVKQALVWGSEVDVYFTFNASIIAEGEQRMHADVPPIDSLRHLYLEIRRRVAAAGTMFHARAVASAVTCAGIPISVDGVRYGLGVFQEAGLLTYSVTGLDEYAVQLLDTGRRKVDLTSAFRYNEGESRREGFATYSAQIMALSCLDLAGLSLGEAASA